MGPVQAVMASPANSLVVSDFMMADEMEDFVGHLASDGPVANEKSWLCGGSTDPVGSAKVRPSHKADAAAPLLASLQDGSLSLPIKRKRL